MTDLVRVRVTNSKGAAEVSLSRSHAEASGLEVLDEPAYRGDGTLRPETRAGGRRVKPRTSVSTEATKKKRGAPAASNAEEATE